MDKLSGPYGFQADRLDGLVKSRKMALFENSRLIITVCYKAAFGNF